MRFVGFFVTQTLIFISMAISVRMFYKGGVGIGIIALAVAFGIFAASWEEKDDPQ